MRAKGTSMAGICLLSPSSLAEDSVLLPIQQLITTEIILQAVTGIEVVLDKWSLVLHLICSI